MVVLSILMSMILSFRLKASFEKGIAVGSKNCCMLDNEVSSTRDEQSMNVDELASEAFCIIP